MTEQAKILRVFKLISYLKTHRRKAPELAGLFEVDKRTIYRYINLLQELGFIVDKDFDDRYFIASYDDTEEGVEFNTDEATLIQQILETGAKKHPLRDGILKKLYIHSELQSISQDVINARSSQLIRKLHRAMENNNRVTLEKYQSASSNTIRDRIVEPISLSEDFQSLQAFDIESGDTKTFKIDRINNVMELNQAMTNSDRYQDLRRDIFGMSGDDPLPIKFELTFRAQLLLREEFPQSLPYLKPLRGSENKFLFDHYVLSYQGVGRFVMGLADQIEVLESGAFIDYLNGKLGFNRFG